MRREEEEEEGGARRKEESKRKEELLIQFYIESSFEKEKKEKHERHFEEVNFCTLRSTIYIRADVFFIIQSYIETIPFTTSFFFIPF